MICLSNCDGTAPRHVRVSLIGDKLLRVDEPREKMSGGAPIRGQITVVSDDQWSSAQFKRRAKSEFGNSADDSGVFILRSGEHVGAGAVSSRNTSQIDHLLFTKSAFSAPSAQTRSIVLPSRIAQKSTIMHVRAATFADKQSREGLLDRRSSTRKALRLLVKPRA